MEAPQRSPTEAVWRISADAPHAGIGPWTLPLANGKRTLTFGRKQEDGVDVLIGTDKSLSRVHAKFAFDDASQSLSVLDFKSTHGVHIGDERLVGDEPRVLTDGAQLKLGSTHLTVRRVAAGASADPSNGQRPSSADLSRQSPTIIGPEKQVDRATQQRKRKLRELGSDLADHLISQRTYDLMVAKLYD